VFRIVDDDLPQFESVLPTTLVARQSRRLKNVSSAYLTRPIPMPKLSQSQERKINIDGMALEKAGRIDDAIALYEVGVVNETSTPGTYERLIALYWKVKRQDDELRICELAAKRWPTARDGYGNVSPSTFASRLVRINARATRRRGGTA
jgi:hypothetical protein